MRNSNRKKHWENIYRNKKLKNVSWFQPTPVTSLDFIKHFNIPATAKIIDIGGGDSLFVDHLLNLGYRNLTILDISAASLARAKQRLGDRSEKVKWLVADAVNFKPAEQYDFWHDRATFHFLTREQEIEKYIQTAHSSLNESGILVIGTFSEQGPKTCSG